MPTVADLLAIDDLALRPVVSANPGRSLRWVATSELANPAIYLEGGELLLTTGLVAHDWPDYVRQIVSAGVVALGFGTGLSHHDVPTVLTESAAAAGLDLLAVPESTPFIAISKAVATLLAEEERQATVDALTLQQELTRLISQRDGVPKVLAALARAGGGSVGLLDAEGATLLPASFRPVPAARRAVQTLRAGDGRGAVTQLDQDGTTVVHPLSPGVEGPFLALTIPGALGSVVRSAVVTTVALLALDAERSRAAVAAELRLRDCVARLVLSSAPEAAGSVAALLQDSAQLPSELRVLRVGEAPSGTRERLARTHPGAMTTAGTGGTLAVLTSPWDAEDLEGALAGMHSRVGVGPAVRLADAAVSDAAATTALAATDERRRVVRWDERFRGAVRAGLTGHAARALSVQILGEVLDEPELLRTLHVYLVHLGHWQPAAAELRIHRNTLRKRMARIAQLTGRDVDTAAGRADLWVALEIARERTTRRDEPPARTRPEVPSRSSLP